MAAPTTKTIKDLNGKWVMNKTLSSDPEPALALQGVSWVTRKAIGLASLTLAITQYEGPPSAPSEAVAPVWHIDIEQTGTGGIKGTTELRCADGLSREHSDWLFGTVRGQTAWVEAADIDDPFLAAGWLEDEAEHAGPGGKAHLRSHVVSVDRTWTATQIWGFRLVDGQRRYCRSIVVADGDKRVELNLVYDYIEE